MKIIVSGGTGFIGRRIVERFLEDGHTVSVWSRQPTLEKRPAVRSFLWDPLTGEPSEESLHGKDAVVHLAGEPVNQRWNPEIKQRIFDSRVLGTRRLVDAMSRMEHRPKVLVSTSAIGYYGERREEKLTESSDPGTGFLSAVCQGWEAEARRAESLGVRVIRLRIGFVLGKGGALAQMLPVFRLGLGGPLGSGRQWMPWIHVADVAGLFAFALDYSGSAVWNAVAPTPVTNADFTRALAHAIHRPAIFPVPPFALKLMFGELGRHMLDSTRVIPDGPLNAGYAYAYPAITDALASLAGKW